MKSLVFFIASLMFLPAPVFAAASAEEILVASDAIRNPGRAFSVTVT